MVDTPLARSMFARARWLVLAPHADDETLGVGALITEAAADRRLAGVAILTDGSGSHPHPDAASRQRLIRVRRREAGLALRRLAGRCSPRPLFLDWRDAVPYHGDSAAFRRSRDRLAALCRRHRIDAIAVTARAEPHCDHAAAFALARAVRDAAPGRIALFEYGVWSVPTPGRARTFRTATMPTGLRRHALYAHHSQVTASFGRGFRLAPAKMRMPARDRLTLWKNRHAA